MVTIFVFTDARVMVVGCRGPVTLNPRFLMLPEASIRGVALGNSTPADYREMGSAIVAGIEAGWVDPVINREYKMDEVQQVLSLQLRLLVVSPALCYLLASSVIRSSVVETFHHRCVIARLFQT